MSITHLTSGMDIFLRKPLLNITAFWGQQALVRDVKVGRERFSEFKPAPLDEARRSLESIGRQWDHALAKLKSVVQSNP